MKFVVTSHSATRRSISEEPMELRALNQQAITQTGKQVAVVEAEEVQEVLS